MSKSKLTLLIDGNWLWMSRMSVMPTRLTDVDQMCKDLKVLIIKSINVVLRQFPTIDNIIFTADGGSFRNKIDVPKFLVEEGIEYKGNREPDPLIDWEKIWAAYDDIISKFNQNGITAVKENGIEGDDWMWYWSNKLNSEGTNVIIWSRDKDLTQLVHTDKDGCFTICWNKETGVICEDVEEDDMNFLFNQKFNENETLFRSISDKSKEIKKINPKAVVIDKIIRGDDSDNIMPIILRKAKSETSEKKYKVSPKDIDETLDWNDKEAVNSFIHNILESKQYAGRVDKNFNDIIDHFNYNKKLVVLEKSSYPEYVIDVFKKYSTYHCSKDISEVQYEVTAEANNISNIANFI